MFSEIVQGACLGKFEDGTEKLLYEVYFEPVNIYM